MKAFPLWIRQQYSLKIPINQCTVCTKRPFKATEDGWKWAPFHGSISPSLFCSILYLITITEADLGAELPAVIPCPTDKPVTLSWTVGSSTTVTASSTTVTWATRGHFTTSCQFSFSSSPVEEIWILMAKRCECEVDERKMFCLEEWANDLRHHTSESRHVYRQHRLLFTGNHGHKPPYTKWLLQFMTSGAAEFDLHSQKSKFFSFQRLAWTMHFNPAARNEMEISEKLRLQTSLSPASWDTYQKKYFRLSSYSFRLMVRVFLDLGRAWGERGRRLMI